MRWVALRLLSACVCVIWGQAALWAGVEYKAKGLRDPFGGVASAPSVPEKSEAGEEVISALEIQGLMVGGSEPLAIVNGQVVKVGSKLKVGEVGRISKEGVVVLFHGKEFILKRREKKAQSQ